MCGIAGIVDFDGLDTASASAAVRRMTATQTHRGPDAGGVWTDDRAVLGHRRLSIIARGARIRSNPASGTRMTSSRVTDNGRPGVHFVVFSDDWGVHPSSCQHLFRHLRATHSVDWINTTGMRAPRVTRADLAKI